MEEARTVNRDNDAANGGDAGVSSPIATTLIVRDDRAWSGGGSLRTDEGGASIIRNPWDDSIVATVPQVSAEELTTALDWAAARVHNTARWPVADRIDAMRAWAGQLSRHKAEIAALETREMGKPIRQTRKITDMVVGRIALLCEARRALNGPAYATDSNRATTRAIGLSTRDPFGLTAGILPFNSPVSALVWKIAPALLMGNAAVIKVSEHAPVAALRAAQMLAELDLPVGALQVIHGRGDVLGPILSTHPGVRKISFTGGSIAGTDVFSRSSATFKRLTLECGSSDPAIILRDADLARAARVVADLGFRTYNGQICTAPKRCIVAKEVCDGFEQMLATEAARVVIGDPMETRTELGPLVSAAAAERVERQVQQAVAAGARLVCGGRRDRAVFPPTLLADVTPDNPIFDDPAFAPVISLVRAADDDDAVALANASRFALRAAVFGRDLQRAASVARRLDCSGVAINGPSLVDNPRLNVEPRKMSGVGAEGIDASLLEYSQPKFIWINDFWPEG